MTSLPSSSQVPCDCAWTLGAVTAAPAKLPTMRPMRPPAAARCVAVSRNALMAFQHQHLGAEVAENLRHLDADHAAADDAELLRRAGEVPDRKSTRLNS